MFWSTALWVVHVLLLRTWGPSHNSPQLSAHGIAFWQRPQGDANRICCISWDITDFKHFEPTLSSWAITLATILPHFSHCSGLLTGLLAANLAFLLSVHHTAATAILFKPKIERQLCNGLPFTQRVPTMAHRPAVLFPQPPHLPITQLQLRTTHTVTH